MRYQILSAVMMLSFAAVSSANAATTLSVAYGASVPKDPSGLTYVQTGGPSRSNGGEHFILKMSPAKTVTDIKISGFSTGKAGKSLIHGVTATTGATTVSLPALSQFSKVTAGNPQNYSGSVMLPDSTYVEATPNQVYSQLDFVVEGFSNDDASLLLQITTSEGLVESEFMLTRTGSHSDQTVGGLINEANYAKFTANELTKLMTNGALPQAADVAGKTYVCSSYSKLDNSEINLKSRAYFMSGSTLQSSSDVEGANLNWTATTAGLTTTIANQNGCGNYATYNVVRKTPGGNLIAEVNLDLNNYVQLCVGAGYDADGIRSVETNSTFPSVVNPNFVVDSYEFCHPAN